MTGTIRKHRPRDSESFDHFLKVVREGQAKQEWQDQQELVDFIKEKLHSLPHDVRKDIISEFCSYCGGEAGCQCWNDE
jgi:hypothetical protein